MKSGLFNRDAITKECPTGFIKICEGTTAVLLPTPMLAKGNSKNMDTTNKHDGPHVSCTNLEQLPCVSNTEIEENHHSVFYNPAQVVNRDLSVCVIETFSQIRRRESQKRAGTTAGITILEALSATGLRAIRYYKEVSNVCYIIANDLDPDAVECITHNCTYNDVPLAQPTLDENYSLLGGMSSLSGNEKGREFCGIEKGIASGSGIIPNLDDAVDLMHRLAINPKTHPSKRLCLFSQNPTADGVGDEVNKKWGTPMPVLQQELMDVVDLDPYGTASPFLDAAFGCIKEGGLMLVTSTDSAILCGNYPGTCHAKYGSIPYKSSHCHEMAVRILLAYMERAANKHKKYIVPLLNLHIDFYVRSFVRVYTQPAEAKLSASKLGYQLQCTNCPAFWVRPMGVAHAPRRVRCTKRRPCRTPQAQSSFSGLHTEGVEATPSAAATALTRDDFPGENAVTSRGVEAYPPAPSRQVDTKLTSLTLQQLPPFALKCARHCGIKRGRLTNCGRKDSEDDAGEDENTERAVSADSHVHGNANFCPVCGSSVSLSGPIYAAPIQNLEFLAQLMETIKSRAADGRIAVATRITGLVQVALEELTECPLFYRLPSLASYVRVRCPPTPLFVAALARLGYRCSQVHCEPMGIKTNCPPQVLFAVMLRWKQLTEEEVAGHAGEPKKRCAKNEHTKGHGSRAEKPDVGVGKILVSPLMDADFDYDRQYDFRRQATGVVKFIPNAPGWGPKRRHRSTKPTGNDEP